MPSVSAVQRLGVACAMVTSFYFVLLVSLMHMQTSILQAQCAQDELQAHVLRITTNRDKLVRKLHKLLPRPRHAYFNSAIRSAIHRGRPKKHLRQNRTVLKRVYDNYSPTNFRRFFHVSRTVFDKLVTLVGGA